MVNYNLLIKSIAFLLTTTCMVVNFVSNMESFRLFLYYQKVQQDWYLFNGMTWNKTRDAISHSVYGAYFLICLGLLIGRVFDKNGNSHRAPELFFYIIGVIAFLALGGLELSALGSVPIELIVKTIVMGGLSISTAIIFLIDLVACNNRRKNNDSVTEENANNMVDDIRMRKDQNMSANQQDTMETVIDDDSSTYAQYRKSWIQQFRSK